MLDVLLGFYKILQNTQNQMLQRIAYSYTAIASSSMPDIKSHCPYLFLFALLTFCDVFYMIFTVLPLSLQTIYFSYKFEATHQKQTARQEKWLQNIEGISVLGSDIVLNNKCHQIYGNSESS